MQNGQFRTSCLSRVVHKNGRNSCGRSWNGDISVADIEELENMDASEMHVRRVNAIEVLTPLKGEK